MEFCCQENPSSVAAVTVMFLVLLELRSRYPAGTSINATGQAAVVVLNKSIIASFSIQGNNASIDIESIVAAPPYTLGSSSIHIENIMAPAALQCF